MTGPDREQVERVREANRQAQQASVGGGTTYAGAGGAPVRTLGISRKLLSTVLAAIGTQVLALLVNWVSTGKFDKVEVAQAVGIVLTAIFGSLSGVVAKPDKQTTAPKGS